MNSLPEIPIPISLVHGRFLLFSIQAVSYLRSEYRICGSLVGTIPQSPSQNVFLGLPVELMPEEAQILVSKGLAYILDDVKAHRQIAQRVDTERKASYMASVEKIGEQASRVQLQKKVISRRKSLKGRSSDSGSSTPLASASGEPPLAEKTVTLVEEQLENKENESLLSPTSTINTATLKPIETPKFAATPATSENLLLTPPDTPPAISGLPSSYPLFKHLHDKGFYLCPGLRFGCQYTVYPGDPLRFHSHFLAVGAEWNEEIDLMDVVGGGRLGTGVKKGYLLGGANPHGDVKTFSIEWAGM